MATITFGHVTSENGYHTFTIVGSGHQFSFTDADLAEAISMARERNRFHAGLMAIGAHFDAGGTLEDLAGVQFDG